MESSQYVSEVIEIDDNRFMTDISDDVIKNNVLVNFTFQTGLELKQALKKLCTEQSISDWAGDPSIEDEMIAKYGAKLVRGSVQVLDTSTTAVMPSPGTWPVYSTVKAQLAFPMDNIERDLVVMLSALGGDTYNIGLFNGIRIEDITLPFSFYEKYSGPNFGIEGVRKISDVYDRPVICGPIKPCIGLKPDQFADIGYQALIGGADMIKDDELLVDPPYNPFKERIEKTMDAVYKARNETGEHKMYIANISAEHERFSELYDIAMDIGVDGVMVSPGLQGFDIVTKISKKNRDKIIIAHNAFLYASAKHPLHGLKYSLFTKIQRMCGADIIVNPCPWGSFEVMSEDEHRDNFKAATSALHNYKQTFMAMCGAQSPSTIPILYRMADHSPDFMMIVGGALFGHPDGPAAGARSLRQGWDAVAQGMKLEEYAQTHKELQRAIQAFGEVRY